MPDILDREYDYYKTHEEELIAAHRGRFLVVADDQVVGVYDDEGDALAETVKTRELGTFLIQQALPSEELVQHFYSRVIIHAA